MITKRNILRYIFMSLHFLMWIIAVAVPWAQTGNYPLLYWHSMIGVAIVIYIPAAFVLGIIDSPSRFTQAGGEVGYLVVQEFLWIRTCCSHSLTSSNPQPKGQTNTEADSQSPAHTAHFTPSQPPAPTH
jgi:hypothetical protein